MKNFTTPRTLADCQWRTGYVEAPADRRITLADVGYTIVCIAAFAGIGFMLAWRG
jgi:hypothetical protein